MKKVLIAIECDDFVCNNCNKEMLKGFSWVVDHKANTVTIICSLCKGSMLFPLENISRYFNPKQEVKKPEQEVNIDNGDRGTIAYWKAKLNKYLKDNEEKEEVIIPITYPPKDIVH